MLRTFVTCLAAYNNGYLHGRWVEVTSDPDDLRDAIAAVLADSPAPGAEEHFFTDYDTSLNMAVPFGEYESIETLCEFVEAVERCDDQDAFAAAYGEFYGEGLDSVVDRADSCYRADTFQDFADEWADELLLTDVPEPARYYFDYDAHARDLRPDCVVVEGPSGCFIFTN